MVKKFYWLKLHKDFFKSKEMKKLRRVAGGDTYTIIYLKLQLLSLDNNGFLYFEGIDESFCEELALELDEDSINVEATFTFLIKVGLLEMINDDELRLPHVIQNIGSETPSASRKRKQREKEKQQKNVTMSQDGHKGITQGSQDGHKKVTTEKEKEKELDIEIKNNNTHKGNDDEKAILNKWGELVEKRGKGKIVSITPTRKKHMKARLKEYGLEKVLEAIDISMRSNFLMYDCKPFGFDWLLNPSNMVKILEGNYNESYSSSEQYKEEEIYNRPDNMFYGEIDMEGVL